MIYQYECPGDEVTVEIERAISEPERSYFCPVCGAKLRRIFNPAPIHFRGKGFYTNDK